MLRILSIEEVKVTWTPAMIDRVRVLLEKGHTYSEISGIVSREFDCRVTRNAVISRAKRSGISDLNKNPRHFSRGNRVSAGRPKSTSPKKHSPPLRLVKLERRSPPRKKPLNLALSVLGEPEDAHAKPLLEALAFECRWPVSDEGVRPMLVCCRPKMRYDVPYCSHHMARAARRLENGGSGSE